MSEPIELYFDFISPYAYLAYPDVVDLARAHGRALSLRPTLFAALLDAHGHKGPAEIPAKREFVFKHALRLAHDAGRRLSPPPAHPFNPLLALRTCTLDMDHATRVALVGALFDATWGGGPGVTDPAVLVQIADGLGLDGAALVARAGEAPAKAALRAATDSAIERGVFGVPTMLVGDELFWGYDAIGHLDAYLRGEDPVDARALERWRDLPAGSVRPGARAK